MHDREQIWTTREGIEIKIKDMTSRHLTNAVRYVTKNIIGFTRMYGEEQAILYKKTMLQELRIRKINMINNKKRNIMKTKKLYIEENTYYYKNSIVEIQKVCKDEILKLTEEFEGDLEKIENAKTNVEIFVKDVVDFYEEKIEKLKNLTEEYYESDLAPEEILEYLEIDCDASSIECRLLLSDIELSDDDRILVNRYLEKKEKLEDECEKELIKLFKKV